MDRGVNAAQPNAPADELYNGPSNEDFFFGPSSLVQEANYCKEQQLGRPTRRRYEAIMRGNGEREASSNRSARRRRTNRRERGTVLELSWEMHGENMQQRERAPDVFQNT